MTDSVKIELPPHDDIASTLSSAENRIVMSEWLPTAGGDCSPHPHRTALARWIDAAAQNEAVQEN